MPHHQAASTSTYNSDWQWQTDAVVGFADKCLDVDGNNTANGTKVQLWECNGGYSQPWTMYSSLAASPRASAIVHEGKCLDISGGVIAPGTKVQLWDCNGTAAQKWERKDDGTIRPASYQSYCLDVSGASMTNGTQIQIYPCNGSAAQQWYYRGRLRRKSVAPYAQQCIDAKDYGTANGTWAQNWNCNGSSAQQFDFFPSGHFPGQ